MTSRSAFIGSYGRSPVPAPAAANLTALACLGLLVLAWTTVNALVGIILRVCISLTPGVLSAVLPRLLPALTACPASLIFFVAAAQLFLLHGVEHSPELRAGGLVLSGWLVVAAAFHVMDRQAFAGHHRDAARLSVVASVVLLLVTAVISSYRSEAIFQESVLADFLNQAYAVGAQLYAVCFVTGVVVAPLALLLRDRTERSHSAEPILEHETVR